MEEVKETFIDMSNSDLTMEAKRLVEAHTALKVKMAHDLENGWATLLELESDYANINRVLKNRNV